MEKEPKPKFAKTKASKSERSARQPITDETVDSDSDDAVEDVRCIAKLIDSDLIFLLFNSSFKPPKGFSAVSVKLDPNNAHFDKSVIEGKNTAEVVVIRVPADFPLESLNGIEIPLDSPVSNSTPLARIQVARSKLFSKKSKKSDTDATEKKSDLEFGLFNLPSSISILETSGAGGETGEMDDFVPLVVDSRIDGYRIGEYLLCHTHIIGIDEYFEPASKKFTKHFSITPLGSSAPSHDDFVDAANAIKNVPYIERVHPEGLKPQYEPYGFSTEGKALKASMERYVKNTGEAIQWSQVQDLGLQPPQVPAILSFTSVAQLFLAMSYSAGIPLANDASKTTLWMGELEPWMDENYVRQLWNSIGENVTVKMIRDKMTGHSAGYCFVDFGNNTSAARQLAGLQGSMIPGTNRVFRLNWASGGGLVDRRENIGQEYSIFVGDLGQEVNDIVLLNTFQVRYESVKSARVVLDPATGMSRGYGFVKFGSEIDSQRAMTEMNGQFCGSRAMRINVATQKNKLMQGGPTGIGMGGMGGMGGGQGGMGQMGGMGMQQGYYPFNPVAMQAQMQQMQLQQQLQQPGAGPQISSAINGQPIAGGPAFGMSVGTNGFNNFPDPNNTTVFIGGLSPAVGDDELRSHFSQFGEIVYTKIPPGKGCGFVQFSTRQSAEYAIQQMNNAIIGGNRVRLSWGKSQAAMK
ncbi:hypothetical protein HK100_005379, partial [Physocladia obscura]